MTSNSSKEQSHHEIINAAMDALCEKNKRAYKILLKNVNEGFFDVHQSKGRINDLADQLIESISQKEE